MKWHQALLLAVLLTLLLGLPFREYDTKKLLPMKTLQAERRDGKIHLVSEAGEGCGKTWEQAVEQLERQAPGEVFFDTAEQAVFTDDILAREAAESGLLRPSAQVYFAEELRDPAGLYEALSAHPSGLKISDLLS